MTRLRSSLLFLVISLSLAAAVQAPSIAVAQPGMGNDRPIGIKNATERLVFSKLRCMCGGCARLPLTECTCGYAADRRDEIRAQIASGDNEETIVAAYAAHFGSEALVVPSNEGANRLLYIVPITLVIAGGVGVGFLLRRLRGGGLPKGGGSAKPGVSGKRDDYDEKLDDELRRLDDE